MRKKNIKPSISENNSDMGAGGAYAGTGYAFDKLMIIRLVLASVLFAAALTGKMSDLLSTVFLILAAVASGYDLVTAAITDVSEGRYFESPLIMVFSAVVAFAVGFGSEGAALLILFRIGLLLVDYTKARTISSAIDFIPADEDDIITHLTLLFSNQETGKTALERRVGRVMGVFTKVILAVAVVYAVVLPLVSDFSYTVSIHRAVTLMVVAAPLSVLASLKLCDVVGIGYCAAGGVVYNSSAAFDRTKSVDAAVFEKSGVFSNGSPRVSSVKSVLLQPDVFIKIAAHIAHKSTSALEKAVESEYTGPIMSEILGDYTEIPSFGSEIKINGISMCLGTRDLMALRGVRIPAEDVREGDTALYMSIAGRYVGCVSLSEEVNPEAPAVVSEYRQAGINDCTLIAQDGNEASAAFASSIGASEFYANCSGEDALAAVEQCKAAKDDGALIFVHSGSLDYHSAADIDACVGTAQPNADIFLTRGGVREIPLAKFASARAAVVEKENITGALVIKLLIILLTLTGYCNLWFAVFLDMAAGLAAILNTIRVSMPPLFTFVKKNR